MNRMIRAIRLRQVTQGNDRGAGTVEYLGGILVVALIIGSLVMGATPVGNTIAYKLCQAVGTTCGSLTTIDAGAPPKAPPANACTVSSKGAEVGFGGSIAFIDMGEKGEVAVDKMSDGTVRVTVSGEVGVEASVSAGEAVGALQIGDYGGGVALEAKAGAGIFSGAGVEYSFKTEKEATEFTDWVKQTTVDGALIASPLAPVGVTRVAGRWVKDLFTGGGYKPPAPNSSYYEGGVSASADVSASAISGGSASAAYSNALGFKLNHDTKDMTFYNKVEISAEAAVQMGLSTSDEKWGAGASGNASIEIVVATTVDSAFELKTVELSGAATAEGAGSLTALAGFPLQGGGGKGVQFSASLDVSGSNRLKTQQILGQMGVATVAGVPPGQAVATAIPALIQEARANGDVTAAFVDVSSQNLINAAVSLKAPLIGGAGINLSASTSSSEVTDAHYLGNDGWKKWTQCAP